MTNLIVRVEWTDANGKPLQIRVGATETFVIESKDIKIIILLAEEGRNLRFIVEHRSKTVGSWRVGKRHDYVKQGTKSYVKPFDKTIVTERWNKAQEPTKKPNLQKRSTTDTGRQNNRHNQQRPRRRIKKQQRRKEIQSKMGQHKKQQKRESSSFVKQLWTHRQTERHTDRKTDTQT